MELLRQVRGSGPSVNPEILICGEAPSREELERGIPFVGPSGRLLRKKLMAAGIPEGIVRFENVIERRITDASEMFLDGKGNSIPNAEMHEWILDVRKRILALAPKVIVPCGSTALFAVTGESSITDHHCTVMKYPYDFGRAAFPIVPVFHPAFVMRAEFSSRNDGDSTVFREASAWLVFGLSKALEVARGKRDISRTLLVRPSLTDALALMNITTHYQDKPVSIDLEIFHNEITCFGFATSPDHAMSIPLSVAGDSYWSEEDEKLIWEGIAKLCASGNPKIFQNFIFDTMHLSRMGIETRGEIFDTMLAATILHAELGKGLDDLGRLFTYSPAWKGKRDWSATVDPENLWRYNATDCAITYEIKNAMELELEELGLRDFHKRHIQELIPQVYSMCAAGWTIDEIAIESIKNEMGTSLNSMLAEILKITGPEFNPRSHKKVKEYLASIGMVIPLKHGKETTDRRALLKLLQKHPNNTLIPWLLKFSKVAKMSSTYTNVKLDPDRRLRFSVNIGGTKSGRFSSSQTPWNTGLNSQNIPSRDPDSPFNFRHIVVADHGHLLVQADLKQADARIVAHLAREESMEEIFNSGGDIHTRVASLIFGMDISGLEAHERKRKRYLGKKCVHSFNYGMMIQTFIETCLDEADLVVTYEEAEALRASYFRAFPRITILQSEIQRELRRSRKLVTPHGRFRSFHGAFDDALFREAYSFIPQATVADVLNEAWLRFSDKNTHPEIRVIGQCHDSILLTVPKELVTDTVSGLRSTFQSVTFKIHNLDRNIPVDISVGPNWRDQKEAA